MVTIFNCYGDGGGSGGGEQDEAAGRAGLSLAREAFRGFHLVIRYNRAYF